MVTKYSSMWLAVEIAQVYLENGKHSLRVHTCVQKLYSCRGHAGNTVARQQTALLTAASHLEKRHWVTTKNNLRR